MNARDDGLTSPEIRRMVDETVERLRRQAHVVSPLHFGESRPPEDVARRLETIRRILESTAQGEPRRRRRSND